MLPEAAGGYNALVQLNVNVTQQQIGDVTVENATNINQSFGGNQHISKTATFHEEKKAAELSRTDLIMKRTVEHFEAWNQGMVKTAALEQILDKLESGTTWLTIKGNPGEGKTTVSFMALEELHKRGRKVFEVRSPEEFSEVISSCPCPEVISSCSGPVIMLDDVFGNLEFDQSKWSSWEPAVSPLLKEREHKSHEREDCTPQKDVTVILVGRDYVLNSASKDLVRLSAFLKSDKYVFCMNHSMQRSMEEKRAIWDSISKSSGVLLDQRSVDEIMEISVAHGFPRVCRLYVTLCKENKAIKAKEFFNGPLEFLNDSVSNIFKDDFKLQLCKEMVKNERISIEELRRLDPTYKLFQAAESMVGAYFRVVFDWYVFDHPSIYESVAFHLCSLDPVFVIQQCNLEFINDRIRLHMSKNCSSTARTESKLIVYDASSYADELAETFSSEIMKNNFNYVLSHQAFTDRSFVRKVMSQVSVPFSKLLHLRDQSFPLGRIGTFLYLVPSSKSPELLRYLDNHPDINLCDKDEKVILNGTCDYAALHVLSYLMRTRSSIDMNVRFEGDITQETPLLKAAHTVDTQWIQKVLSLKPDLNAKDIIGRTALHFLCDDGLVSVVTQMIDSGAHIDVEDSFHNTPLCCACRSKHIDVINLLILKGAKIDRRTLESACCQGNIDVVKLLFEKETSLCDKEALHSALHSACKTDSVDILQFLVNKGASVNTSSSFLSLVKTVCSYHKQHALKWLLKQINERGCHDISGTILKTGAVLNVHDKDGNSVLLMAATSRFKECLDMLLKAGADVNIQNKDGDTPLHEAAWLGSEECVEILLEAGADVNIQNKDGDTALHKATCEVQHKRVWFSRTCSKECVTALLLMKVADVNIQNRAGDTALHGYARLGSEECVEILLEAGADVNIQNKDGDTALHKAAECGSEECVDLLLKAGADENLQNNDGDTALHIEARS